MPKKRKKGIVCPMCNTDIKAIELDLFTVHCIICSNCHKKMQLERKRITAHCNSEITNESHINYAIKFKQVYLASLYP